MIQELLIFDTNLLIWARSLIGPDYAGFIRIIGESVVLWGGILLLGIWITGIIKKDVHYKTHALEIFSVIILTFILYALINYGMPQHWRISPQEVAGTIGPLIPHPIDNSFPSGHALFSMSLLIGLVTFYQKKSLIILTIIFGIATTISRIIGGVHYPGDILGGFFFGGIGAYIAIHITRTHIVQKYIYPSVIKVASWIKL